jgi:hypothetical protein
LLSRNSEFIRSPDRDRLSVIGGLKMWTNAVGCEWINYLPMTDAQMQQSQAVVPRIWTRAATDHPVSIVKIHATRNAYLLPVPRRRAMNTPFIHSIIEFPGRGVEWANPRLAEAARNYVRVWNAGRGLLAFAGVWLAVLTALAAWRRDVVLLPTIFMAIGLEVPLLITAPIADARYALFVLITGQAALVGAVLQARFAARANRRRPSG